MIKILFICHGNICRSPMAEFVMKDLVRKAGLEWKYEIASAATSSEELGNPVYPPARRKLAETGMDKLILKEAAKGKPIKAKTVGQRQYIKAIEKNTVVFGIGPAGTGKTFLAVAMAVKALRDKHIVCK